MSNRSYDDIINDLDRAYAKAAAAARAIKERKGDRSALRIAFRNAVEEAHRLEAELEAAP